MNRRNFNHHYHHNDDYYYYNNYNDEYRNFETLRKSSLSPTSKEIDEWDLENYAYMQNRYVTDTSQKNDQASNYYYDIYVDIDQNNHRIHNTQSNNNDDEFGTSSSSSSSNSRSEEEEIEEIYESESGNESRLRSHSQPESLNYLATSGPESMTSIPLLEREKTRRLSTPYSLTNYGHLKIDYSWNWNQLNRFIKEF